jgi:hypothetical protein
VNHACGLRRGVTDMDGPGTHFLPQR